MKQPFICLAIFVCWYSCLSAQDSTARIPVQWQKETAHRSYKWALALEAGNFGPDENTNPLLIPYSYNEKPYSQSLYSCTAGLALSRKFSRSCALQLRLGYAHPVQTSDVDGSRTIHTNSGQVTDPGFYMVEHLVSQEKVGYVAGGISGELLNIRRFSFHAGLEGVFLRYWDKKAQSDILEYVSPGNGPNPYRNEKYVYSGEQAFALGLNAFTGVDLRLCHHLKLGAGLSAGYLYNKLYGNRLEEYHSYLGQGPQSTTPFSIPQNRESVAFSPLRVTIHFTWLF